VTGWLSSLWEQIKAVPTGYLIAGVVLETGQTVLTGLSYYGILARPIRAGDDRADRGCVRCRRRGNGFLPANIGTFVTLLMFVAIIPGATFGAHCRYLVQKIFFTVAGTFSTSTSSSPCREFTISFGNLTSHPTLTFVIVASGGFLLVLVGRLVWSKVKKLWAQAKQGSVILSQPRATWVTFFCPRPRVPLPAGRDRGLPRRLRDTVTFNSIMWVVAPARWRRRVVHTGGVGVTQATNALALKSCCNVPNTTAVAYSTAQQLVTTAWDVLFAVVAGRLRSLAGCFSSS